jgi:hypothetical protein
VHIRHTQYTLNTLLRKRAETGGKQFALVTSTGKVERRGAGPQGSLVGDVYHCMIHYVYDSH